MYNNCDVITLAGDIDTSCVDDLMGAIDAFRESVATDAVVDLSDVTFVGSEALGFVARLGEIAHNRGGRVTLVNANAASVRVADLCGNRDAATVERRFLIPRPRLDTSS
jgi:anti-anti-sigma factor